MPGLIEIFGTECSRGGMNWLHIAVFYAAKNRHRLENDSSKAWKAVLD
jgi:hypothetical protein